MLHYGFSYVVLSFTVNYCRSCQTTNYMCQQKRFEGINLKNYDAPGIESHYRNFKLQKDQIGTIT